MLPLAIAAFPIPVVTAAFHVVITCAGVYVTGLYLDGAGWDRKNIRLCEPTAKVLFSALPVIHMYAVNNLVQRDNRLYQCPVYKKPCRTDLTYITSILLRTNQSPDHWTLRGVAALCSL